MDRRQFLATAALLPMALAPISTPEAATQVVWQDWPIGTPRPDEWRTGTTTIARLFKRIREDGGRSDYHIKNVF